MAKLEKKIKNVTKIFEFQMQLFSDEQPIIHGLEINHHHLENNKNIFL